MVARLRSAFMTPFLRSQAERARRTCSDTGTPSRSLTRRNPVRMSSSSLKAVCFFLLGVTLISLYNNVYPLSTYSLSIAFISPGRSHNSARATRASFRCRRHARALHFGEHALCHERTGVNSSPQFSQHRA